MNNLKPSIDIDIDVDVDIDDVSYNNNNNDNGFENAKKTGIKAVNSNGSGNIDVIVKHASIKSRATNSNTNANDENGNGNINININSHKSTSINETENSYGNNIKNVNDINFCIKISSTQTPLTDTPEPHLTSLDYEIFVKIQERESIDNACQDKENKYYRAPNVCALIAQFICVGEGRTVLFAIPLTVTTRIISNITCKIITFSCKWCIKWCTTCCSSKRLPKIVQLLVINQRKRKNNTRNTKDRKNQPNKEDKWREVIANRKKHL